MRCLGHRPPRSTSVAANKRTAEIAGGILPPELLRRLRREGQCWDLGPYAESQMRRKRVAALVGLGRWLCAYQNLIGRARICRIQESRQVCQDYANGVEIEAWAPKGCVFGGVIHARNSALHALAHFCPSDMQHDA